jgi:hypothetical protein
MYPVCRGSRDGKRLLSVPISAMRTRAVVSLSSGILVSRLTAAPKGPSASPTRASISAIAACEGVDLA